MFQYEIHNLKSGKVFYRHIFVDKDYQITITRAELSREQLRDYLHIFLVLRRQSKVHIEKHANEKGVFYTVKIFN